MWRALKSLSGRDARKVIVSVKNEDGFKAWQKLHMHFGPSLSAKQGIALADFTSTRSVREPVSATTAKVMATLRASVPPRSRAKDLRKAQTRERERT